MISLRESILSSNNAKGGWLTVTKKILQTIFDHTYVNVIRGEDKAQGSFQGYCGYYYLDSESLIKDWRVLFKELKKICKDYNVNLTDSYTRWGERRIHMYIGNPVGKMNGGFQVTITKAQETDSESELDIDCTSSEDMNEISKFIKNALK